MQRSSEQFEESFRKHLVPEQRRAVLEAIASELTPETTLGEVVDAAENLGWGDHMEGLCLAALAGMLVDFDDAAAPDDDAAAAAADDDAEETDEVEAAEAADEEDRDDEADDADEDDEVDAADEVEDEPAPGRRKKTRKVVSARARTTVTRKKPARKAATRKKATRKTTSRTTKKSATTKKTRKGQKSRVKVVAPIRDEAMSLEQAAQRLVPLVRKMKQATMQDLEEATGLGRRKLRFHVGQLVKHGKLKRHGMGRGTHYTVK